MKTGTAPSASVIYAEMIGICGDVGILVLLWLSHGVL